MKVIELIRELQKLDPQLEVMKTSYDGCVECNPCGSRDERFVESVHVEMVSLDGEKWLKMVLL